MEEIIVHVEVNVNPTESEDKVKRAVENIFGNIPLRSEALSRGSLLSSEVEGVEALTKLWNLLRRERIRNAARRVLSEGLRGNVISFCLNKQVAYAGHVSFSKDSAESSLGPIRVELRCSRPRELINWIAPRTV